jgi:hypothetical protein
LAHADVDRAGRRRYGPHRAQRRLARLFPVQVLGRSQAVRQRILIPPFGGSIPPAPASFDVRFSGLADRTFSTLKSAHFSFCNSLAGRGWSHTVEVATQAIRPVIDATLPSIDLES